MPHSEVSSGTLSRRDLLLTGGLTGLGLLAGGQLRADDAAQPKATPAAESFMKLSLAAYSFNRFLPRPGRKRPAAETAMTLHDVIDFAAGQGIPGIELTGYYLPEPTTDEVLNNLKRHAFLSGLDISGTAIGNDFCQPEGRAWEKQVQLTRNWIDIASTMGAPVIRIFAGRVPKGDTEENALKRCIEGIRVSLDYAEQKGVFLALENHGGITATPDQMLRIMEPFLEHPWFGVNFDSGNFKTDDPYRDLARIAPYAINAQIKVMITKNGVKMPADLPRVIDILQRANYRGYVVLEFEEENPHAEIPKYLDQLRDLIA